MVKKEEITDKLTVDCWCSVTDLHATSPSISLFIRKQGLKAFPPTLYHASVGIAVFKTFNCTYLMVKME